MAVQRLHNQKRCDVVVAEIPDRDDVRMEPPPGGPRFPAEALKQLLASATGDQLGADDLDCNQAIDCRVMGAIDFAHRPRAEQCFDAIAADRPDSVHFLKEWSYERMAAPGTQSSENRLLPLCTVHFRTAGAAGGLFGPSQVCCSSSMLIAFCRLRRIRLNEADSEPISSLLSWTYSGVSSCPMLTLSAISEISATGLVTSARSKRSTMMIVTTKVPARASINQKRA